MQAIKIDPGCKPELTELPKEKNSLNGCCKTGKSPSGHCGAAAYCSEPYACCVQCPKNCNARCGWISAKEDKT